MKFQAIVLAAVLGFCGFPGASRAQAQTVDPIPVPLQEPSTATAGETAGEAGFSVSAVPLSGSDEIVPLAPRGDNSAALRQVDNLKD